MIEPQLNCLHLGNEYHFQYIYSQIEYWFVYHIAFEDLNKIDLKEWKVTEDEATRLLHVIHKEQLYVGTKAFLVLWEQMPRYRFLAKIGRLPGIFHIANFLYVHVVARVIYNRHIRRKSRGLI